MSSAATTVQTSTSDPDMHVKAAPVIEGIMDDVDAEAKIDDFLATEVDPPAKADDPPAKADDPPAKADDPPAKADDPPAKADDPPAEADDPPAEADDPPAEADDPPAEADDPPAKADDPSAKADDHPPSDEESGEEYVPSANDDDEDDTNNENSQPEDKVHLALERSKRIRTIVTAIKTAQSCSKKNRESLDELVDVVYEMKRELQSRKLLPADSHEESAPKKRKKRKRKASSRGKNKKKQRKARKTKRVARPKPHKKRLFPTGDSDAEPMSSEDEDEKSTLGPRVETMVHNELRYDICESSQDAQQLVRYSSQWRPLRRSSIVNPKHMFTSVKKYLEDDEAFRGCFNSVRLTKRVVCPYPNLSEKDAVALFDVWENDGNENSVLLQDWVFLLRARDSSKVAGKTAYSFRLAPTQKVMQKIAGAKAGNNTSSGMQESEDEAGSEKQEDAISEQQDGEDASSEQQDGEDASSEQQDGEDASSEQQDGEDASSEQQDGEDASSEQQDGEDASSEHQGDDGNMSDDLP